MPRPLTYRRLDVLSPASTMYLRDREIGAALRLRHPMVCECEDV
jgi:hypothetical protein